jgi:two-component system, sporulation sensor kinase E
MAKKKSSLDRILENLEDLDAANLSHAVQRLMRERRLLETVINTCQDGILVVDESGIIQYANSHGALLIGLKEENVGKENLWKLVPDLRRSLEGSTFQDDEEGSFISRELEMSYPEHRLVRLYMVPLQEGLSTSRLRNLVIVLTDITQDRLSTEQLIESEKVNSVLMLASGVAHELGNPLNSLTIHLQLMERKLKKLSGVEGLAKLNFSVEVCQKEVQRLDSIITHFLEALRPKTPDLKELNLLHVIGEVMDVQGVEFENRSIIVQIDFIEKNPIIQGDADQVKQVLFNLLKNSLEAMQKEERLKILCRGDDDNIYLQLADTGEGIAEEDISKVFLPYYSTKDKGHGLGMMIVQRIMREHGGRIGIDSKPGVGTVVTLQFPRKYRRVRLLENKSTSPEQEN